MMKLLKEGFDMIEIKLKIFCKNKYPMSRSEARRILESLSMFKEVMLDFEEINSIGRLLVMKSLLCFRKKHQKLKLITSMQMMKLRE
ncbi:hypothetical protein [Acetobacterium carbinolicum]|uniref:hypothetical protein n=1 Tax=Acetobacterium carbinolicum TaxID=52690 RepID=UPI0039C97476